MSLKSCITKIDRDDYLMLGLAFSFFASRVLLYIFGFNFNMDYLESAWQNVDVWLLQNDLLRSIWFLHSQPPFFNLFIGVVLKIFPEHFSGVFQIIYHILGLVLAWCVYLITNRLTYNRFLSFFCSLLFILSPSVILFENFFFYDFPVMVILVIVTLYFQKFAVSGKTRDFVLFFSIAVFLILSRRIFHIVWLLTLFGVILYFYRKEWKRLILASCIPLIIVLFWFGKNQYYFGKFDASTWTGMGFFKTATYILSTEEREALLSDGIVSPNIFYGSDPFQIPVSTSSLSGVDEKLMYASVLGSFYKKNGGINYNHPAYIGLSHELMDEFVSILKQRPLIYAKGAVVTSIIFFSPASGYFAASENNNAVDINYQVIKQWDIFFNKIVFMQPLAWGGEKMKAGLADWLHIKETQAWRLLSPGIFLIAMYLVSLGYGIWILFQKNSIQRRGMTVYMTILFLILNIFYVSAVGILAEAGENQRHRFMIEPLTWILFAFFIHNVFLNKKKTL